MFNGQLKSKRFEYPVPFAFSMTSKSHGQSLDIELEMSCFFFAQLLWRARCKLAFGELETILVVKYSP